MIANIIRNIKNKKAQGLVEYSTTIMLIAIGVMAVAVIFRDEIMNVFNIIKEALLEYI